MATIRPDSPMVPASPLVSVIVTAHDRLSYLPNALASLERQTLDRSDFEVVVVTNREVSEVRPLVANEEVQLLSEPNPSLGQKIATAFRHAQGKVICFLEDDDAFRPDKLAIVVEEFERRSDLGYFHNHYSLVDAADHLLPPSTFRARTDRLLRSQGPVRLTSEERWSHIRRLGGMYPEFNNSCISVRRELLESHLRLLTLADLATDQLLLLLVLRSPWTLLLDGRRLTSVRLHGANVSQISETSRSGTSRGLVHISQRNVCALEALVESLKEGQSPQYCGIVDSVLAVEKTLHDLRVPETRRGRYWEDLGHLLRLRSTYVVQTRRPLLLMVGMAALSPALARSFYRSFAGRIS